MTLRTNHVALLALAGLALLTTPAAAVARCVPPPPIEQAVATSDVVFVGTVVSTERQGAIANVLVAELWRGPDLPVNVRVLAGPGGGRTSVDREFEAGTRYLFIPTVQADGSLGDSACSSTMAWGASLELLRPAVVRSPIAPVDTTAQGTSFDPWTVAGPIGVAMLVAAALLGIGLLARGRRNA